MENKEQNSNQQDTIQVATPAAKTQQKKARPTRKTANKPKEETSAGVNKIARKPRTKRTLKEKKSEESINSIPEETKNEAAATTAKTEEQSIEVQQPKESHIQHQKEAVAATTATTRQEQSIPPLPSYKISNIVELAQAPMRSIVLTDQQIQQLTLEEIDKRHRFLEDMLSKVLDYDVVISDTNIWLELLIGHTSNHSDPKFNARLQFERQLEFISKLMYYRGGRFIMMGETYEEIDRFASMQDPTNHRDADFTDSIVCLNTAARLAKRLILAQQRENRLRIIGIGAESHHAAFADPAIIKKVAELFACGKKVLLLTNDASVAIRTMGICDDLQRHNNVSDAEWDEKYAPLRPMVFTFEDLKLLDYYTRQYYYIQMAAGTTWMEGIERTMQRNLPEPLTLWPEAFRPGDKHRSDNLFTEQEKQQTQQKQKLQEQQKKQQEPKKKGSIQQKQPVVTGSSQAELKPTEQPVSIEKKEEQKTGTRSRRKPQRSRKNTTEKAAGMNDITENAQ